MDIHLTSLDIMKKTLMTENNAARQKEDIEVICNSLDWDFRIDVACARDKDDSYRCLWGGYSKENYEHRSSFIKYYVRKTFEYINKKLRSDKHYPLYFVHEFGVNDFYEEDYSGHLHGMIKNDSGYSNDLVYKMLKRTAAGVRRKKGLDVNIQYVDKENGPSAYIAKYVEYDKMVDHNPAFRRLVDREAETIREYRTLIRMQQKQFIKEVEKELMQKAYKRYPYLDPSEFISGY